jgi:hypothetical protein
MRYTAEQVEDALNEVVDANDYSGRGMYGERCPSFNADTESEAFSAFVRLAEDNPEMAAYLAKTARTDSMGRGMVIYWPSITYPKTEGAEAA